MQELGFAIHPAREGSEAIALLHSENPFDVVVTDILMLGVSGFDVCDAARFRRPGMPVVFVSGFIPPDMWVLLQRDERTQLVNKPFTVDELRAAVLGVMH
jgi:DNA-binding NtrC family response regulator